MQEKQASVTELHEQGLSERRIATTLGITRSQVRRQLHTQKEERRRSTGRAPLPATSGLTGSAKDLWSHAQSGHMGDMGFSFHMPDEPGQWNSFGLDSESWSQFGSKLTIQALSSMSPSISRAIWDYLRLLDPGHEIKVFIPGTEKISTGAQAVLDKFIETRIEPYYSSMTGMIQQLNMGVLYRGALCCQLLTDDTGREAYGIIVPDPQLIVFRAKEDVFMGRIWEPGVEILGEWKSVKSPYFHYVPFDPQPGDPYGRSIVGASMFPSMFLLGLLYDLRRVVAQQGYPRKDITVLTSKLRETFADVADDDFKDLVEDFIDEVSAGYSRLEPDSAFVHTDAVTVGNNEGSVDGAVIGGSKTLLDMLERLEVRALKTMPIMMGLPSSASESDSNRQWEIFVQGIKHMQHFCENVLENVFESVLRLKGIQGKVEVRFAEIRSAEILRDEQTKAAVIANLRALRDEGWISDDEASEQAVGHAPTGERREEPEPQIVVSADALPVEPTKDMSEPEDDGGPEDVGPEGYAVTPAWKRHRRITAGMRLILGSQLMVDEGVISNVVARWREFFRGKIEEELLDAVPVATAAEVKGRTDSRWYWDMERREFLTPGGAIRDTVATRLLFEKFKRGLQREAADETAAWNAIHDALIAGAIVGHGGSENMGRSYDAELGRTLADQYGYWQEFQADMQRMENEDADQLEADRQSFFESRWPLYLGIGVLLYELSRADEWGLELEHVPPRHPHCDCFLEFGEDDKGPWVTWQQVDESCPECLRLAGEYDKWRGKA